MKKVFGIIFLVLAAIMAVPLCYLTYGVLTMLISNYSNEVEDPVYTGAFTLGTFLALFTFLIPFVLLVIFGIKFVKAKKDKVN